MAFGSFDPQGKYSDWARGKGMEVFEDYLGKGKSFDKPMVDHLQQLSSVAPQYDAQGNLANSSEMWSDYVARVQDKDSGTSSMISELGIGNDKGSKLALAAAAAMAGYYYGGNLFAADGTITGSASSVFGDAFGTASSWEAGTAGLSAAETAGAAAGTAGAEWAATPEMLSAAETASGASGASAATEALTAGAGEAVDTLGPIANQKIAEASNEGLVSRFMGLHPAVQQAATLGAAGLITGAIGGAGQYLTQNTLLDKRIAADREAQAQKVRETQELEEWKRRFTQGGSYFNADVPIAPKARQLLRPDGTPVYGANGLVTRAMGG